MNRWYNGNKTKMLDLDSVVSYDYFNHSYLKESLKRTDIDGYDPILNAVKTYGHYLIVQAGGIEHVFKGPEALEIYKMLSNNGGRQVI